MSTVSYDDATKQLIVNEVVFDLRTVDENEPVDIRNQIGKISIGDTEISSFYNGDNNEYSILNVSDDIDVINSRSETIKRILVDLKKESKRVVKTMTSKPNANVFLIEEDTFTKFITVIMLLTKILTGVLILQKVGQAKCELPKKQDKMIELEGKINRLKEFIQKTSNLLFMMETVTPTI